ncbi:MAG: hypothetical protein SFY81_08905 [Verrucomicrobiota bacterium]|nr:hypothetical protein [Verrucomicrobiota bacterium]
MAKKVLIKNCKTGEFLKNVGCWILDPHGAMNFVSTLAAVEFITRHHIPDAELLIDFGSRLPVESLPLGENCREIAPSSKAA